MQKVYERSLFSVTWTPLDILRDPSESSEASWDLSIWGVPVVGIAVDEVQVPVTAKAE